jgi:DNA polymerase II small subunit
VGIEGDLDGDVRSGIASSVLNPTEIVSRFAERGFNIHPKAVRMLQNLKLDELDRLIELLSNSNSGAIVTPESLKDLFAKRTDSKRVDSKTEDLRIKVEKDITGNSSCEGGIEDFISHFNSRFEKLSRILRRRVRAIPIGSLWKIKPNEAEVIGIVCGVRETSSGNYLIELEDKSGRINVIATGKLREVASELLGDEVLAVSGILKGKNLIANRIIFPDVPQNGKKPSKDFAIVFTSDIHFGSNAFLEESWGLFIRWLSGELGNDYMRELAEKVRCVLIAGDVVDGVGIYPGQERELKIIDIYGQYEEAAEHLDAIPKKIKVVLSPGNHDAVRQAEPQPALPKEFASLFPKNVIHVGNPAWVDVDGVRVLIYHGRSFDDIILKIPRLDYSNPVGAIEEILKRRHLVPIYGGRSPLAPEKDDLLVIDEVPDVIHTGHVHTYGAKFYRGVLAINSSAWQAQTEFQKKVNLNPMPGNVPVYGPNGKIHRLRFYKGS